MARAYDGYDRARLIVILRAKNLEFSLDDIKQDLELLDADQRQPKGSAHLLEKVDRRLAQLQGKQTHLDRMLRDLGELRARIATALEPSRNGPR
jgi:DNA-binding transcriptional MerR regulator